MEQMVAITGLFSGFAVKDIGKARAVLRRTHSGSTSRTMR